MSSVKNSASTPQPSPAQKPPTLAVSEMLTPSELAQLAHTANELAASARKAFPNLKTV